MLEKIALFSWFQTTMEQAFSEKLPGQPCEILRYLSAPEELCEWVNSVENAEFSVKKLEQEVLPDLESRGKKVKKTSGQFYTPEDFARELIHEIKPDLTGLILDPSCGDGSFLLSVATVLKKKCNCKTRFLDQLYGYDTDKQALLVCLARLKSFSPHSGWPKLVNADFLLSRIEQRFNFIIGNPPYKVNLSEEIKEHLKNSYTTSEGEKDLYTFFIERSIRLLRPNSSLVMLTSHTYLVNHQCRLIRELVFSREVKDLFLLPTRFFPSAPGVLPVVLHLNAQEAGPDSMVTINSNYSPGKGWGKKFKIDSASLIDGKGLRQAIVPENLKRVFKRMSEQFVTLGEVCRVGVGIQESIKRTEQISKFVCNKAESKRHRPVIKGRELSPFKINWEGKYIDYGPHLAYAGDENIFVGRKLLYQNIRNEKLKTRLVAAYDDSSFFPKNSLSYIIVRDENLSEIYLEALLNSVLVNSWFSGRFHSFHITVSQVRTIPVPVVEDAPRKKIEKLAMVLRQAETGSSAQIDALKKLNLLVCECYLGPGEHLDLLADCENFLEQAASL